MPELKNIFTQGKMNLDLDERITPNGQYREAMNVLVSTSDDTDIGAVQNILGNTSIIDQTVFNSLTTNFECIGSVADEKSNSIYYFITDVVNNSKDAIIRYKNNAATPVLVDTKSGTPEAVLKFSNITKDMIVNGASQIVQRMITGINIVSSSSSVNDDLLFWTDGINEPRKINIQDCINGSSNNSYTLLSLSVSNLSLKILNNL